MPHLPWKRLLIVPSKTFEDSSPAGAPPIRQQKTPGGGVIGKQSPVICFSCERQPLPTKANHLC